MPSIFSEEYLNLKLKSLIKNPKTWLLIMLAIFWVNSHSSFVELYFLMATGIIIQFFKNFFSTKEKKLSLRNPLLLLAVLGLACLANPSFFRIFDTFVLSTKETEEFFSIFQLLPKFGWLYFSIISVYLIGLLIFIISLLRRGNYFKGLVLLAFVLLGVYSNRFLADMGIVAAVFLIAEVPYLFKIKEKLPINKTWLNVLLFIFMSVQTVALFAYQRPFGWGVVQSAFPVMATKYLNQLPINGNMFNSYDWGGYLIWATPKHPVYIDGRIQIYPTEFIDNYLNNFLTRPPAYFISQAKKWQISFAIVPYPKRMDDDFVDYTGYLFDKANWALVYFDNVALVYMKRDFSMNNDSLIKSLEYRFLEPTTLSPNALDVYFIDPATQKILVDELNRSLSVVPDSIYSHFFMGYCQYRLGNIDGAINELEITKKLFPSPQVLRILERVRASRRQ